MAIAVKRIKRKKNVADQNSRELYYLKPVPGRSQIFNTKKIARRVEKVGALSAQDVAHVTTAIAREIKELLMEGHKVKIDELGIFHLTINSTGVEEEKDCTVRNIRKVNIRFIADSTLRLVNDATATTRGGENNVEFYMEANAPAKSVGDTGNGEGDGAFIDPTA